MRIATWNVNSIRVRVESVVGWIKLNTPHILLLQELKCQEHQFPFEIFEDLGYNIFVVGQKTYNGVAILSKWPLEDKRDYLINSRYDDPLQEARYCEAITHTVRIASVYVPNGASIDSVSYIRKLQFLDDLAHRLTQLHAFDDATVIGGDFNIAPEDSDIYDPIKCANHILFSKPEREKLQDLFKIGYSDAIRHVNLTPTVNQYTWWDYRMGAFKRNLGARIDHLLLSPHATLKLTHAGIDALPRGLPRASDHVPVWCELK